MWLNLAKEVEPLFGQMVENKDFRMAIKECILNESAFCVVNNNNIEGIVAIVAIDKIENAISWIAVRKNSRGQGYGYKLLKKEVDCLNNEKSIHVQTFADDVKGGEIARKMYMQFGFKDYKDGGKNPADINTVIMKLG